MSPDNKLVYRHTIASYFARNYLKNAISLGGNKQQILTQAGLTAKQLKPAKSRVSATQLASIVKSGWQINRFM